MNILKDVCELTDIDIQNHPIWEFNLAHEEMGETVMSPVIDLPVTHLIGRLVGTQVLLACGIECPALLGNLDLQNFASNEHFLTISFMKGLARCHFGMDPFFSESAQAVADLLGYPVNQVFPISFDISKWCIGNEKSVRGSIPKKFSTKLSQQERIKLAMEKAARAYDTLTRK